MKGKPAPDAVTVPVALPPAMAREIEARAQKMGMSAGEYLALLVSVHVWACVGYADGPSEAGSDSGG